MDRALAAHWIQSVISAKSGAAATADNALAVFAVDERFHDREQACGFLFGQAFPAL